MPVIAPSGDNNKDNPRLPSLNCKRCLIPGIAATQVPKSKLDVANKNPTASTGFVLKKEVKFFSIVVKQNYNIWYTSLYICKNLKFVRSS